MADYLLAIDDEPELLSIVRRIGEAAGYKVDTTTDPELFKEIAASERPGVILIDLQMPGCDGVELLEFLAARKCSAAILLSSGFDSRVVAVTKDLGAKLGLNMATPLPKPGRAAALKEVLDYFRERRFDIDATTLRAAIDDDQLELHFQPLVDLRERHLIGWEGLVRWQHPEQGLIMPDRFISVAESGGLIDTLSDRVAELAVRQLADWRGDGRNSFVSINLSAQNLADVQLPDRESTS